MALSKFHSRLNILLGFSQLAQGKKPEPSFTVTVFGEHFGNWLSSSPGKVPRWDDSWIREDDVVCDVRDLRVDDV